MSVESTGGGHSLPISFRLDRIERYIDDSIMLLDIAVNVPISKQRYKLCYERDANSRCRVSLCYGVLRGHVARWNEG